MKSIGRDNARDAGTAGPDPKTILGLTLLGILIVIIAVIIVIRAVISAVTTMLVTIGFTCIGLYNRQTKLSNQKSHP